MKLQCDEPLSSFAFNFNLRRYIMGPGLAQASRQSVAAGGAAPQSSVSFASDAFSGFSLGKVGRAVQADPS